MELQEDPQVDDRDDDDENIIMIRMDIKEPLNTIKSILEDQVDDIAEYKFTLQGGEELDGCKNLLDHCVQGEGQVQINLVLRFTDTHNTIDIIDVLKPTDEVEDDSFEMVVVKEEPPDIESNKGLQTDVPPDPGSSNNIVSGTEAAIGNINEPNNSLDQSSKKKRRRSVPSGQKRPRVKKPTESKSPIARNLPKLVPKLGTNTQLTSQALQMKNASSVQLWQFLLELLTSHSHRNVIQWLDREGEFKLVDPEKVAELWGLRKHKPNMNYDKLSRALRYYYDGDMISKVPGQSFVYKFICDLKFMIGYTARELNAFVLEAELAMGRNPKEKGSPMGSPSRSPKIVDQIPHGVVMASDFNLD